MFCFYHSYCIFPCSCIHKIHFFIFQYLSHSPSISSDIRCYFFSCFYMQITTSLHLLSYCNFSLSLHSYISFLHIPKTIAFSCVCVFFLVFHIFFFSSFHNYFSPFFFQPTYYVFSFIPPFIIFSSYSQKDFIFLLCFPLFHIFHFPHSMPSDIPHSSFAFFCMHLTPFLSPLLLYFLPFLYS